MHLEDPAGSREMNSAALVAWIRDERPNARETLKELDKDSGAQRGEECSCVHAHAVMVDLALAEMHILLAIAHGGSWDAA